MKLFLGFLVLFCLSFGFSHAQNDYYVLFEFNKDEVPDSAMAFLVKNIYTQNIKSIYLEGHCDSVGSKHYNYDLSRRRVNAVKSILVQNGFDAKKIEGKVAFGKDKPLNDNLTAIDRQKNRRVLVKFETTLLEEKAIIPIPEIKNLGSKEFKKGDKISLPSLLFYGGRHVLLNSSLSTLDSLLIILKKYPDMKFEIQGHVCCTTTELDGFDWDTGTDNLSVNRALAIYQWLISKGIDKQRMTYKGFGGTQKIYLDESDLNKRALNRRVEILILEE